LRYTEVCDTSKGDNSYLPVKNIGPAAPLTKVLSGEITVTYPGPPGRPSDAWRLVENRVACTQPLAGYPRVAPHRTGASVPDPATPRASRLGSVRRTGSLTAVEYVIEFLSPTTEPSISWPQSKVISLTVTRRFLSFESFLSSICPIPSESIRHNSTPCCDK